MAFKVRRQIVQINQCHLVVQFWIKRRLIFFFYYCFQIVLLCAVAALTHAGHIGAGIGDLGGGYDGGLVDLGGGHGDASSHANGNLVALGGGHGGVSHDEGLHSYVSIE